VTLKYTLDQVRDRVVAAHRGEAASRTRWWPLRHRERLPRVPDSNASASAPGRSSNPHFISISAFRAWAGWDEVAVEDAVRGPPLLELLRRQLPEHIEFIYSIDHRQRRR
jgi:hypothetical protein